VTSLETTLSRTAAKRYNNTHTGLFILQPDGWIEQRGIYKKNKIKIALSNILKNVM